MQHVQSYSKNKLDRLIAYEIETGSTQKKEFPIPFPDGYNSKNCLVIPVSHGGDFGYNITIKINYNQTTYSVIGINNYNYFNILFIFILKEYIN